MVLITLGPSGTFSEQVAKLYFKEEELILMESIAAVFSAQLKDDNSHALLPLKNSVSGFILETLEGLITNKLYIEAIFSKDIAYVLAKAFKDKKSQRIYVHPHAFKQCKDYLHQFKHMDYIFTESNSYSARYAKNDPLSIALTTKEAANEMELSILEENIKDDMQNCTYFGVISQELRNNEGKNLLLAANDSLSAENIRLLLRNYVVQVEEYNFVEKKWKIFEIFSEKDIDQILAEIKKDLAEHSYHILGRY